MRRAAAYLVLAGGAFLLGWFVGGALGADRNLTFQVLPDGRGTAKNEVWVRPYVAPAFLFRVREGEKPPKGAILCKRTEEHKEWSGHEDTFLILDCVDVKMELVGVDFAH